MNACGAGFARSLFDWMPVRSEGSPSDLFYVPDRANRARLTESFGDFCLKRKLPVVF